jgi:positive phototaxis protein PixI
MVEALNLELTLASGFDALLLKPLPSETRQPLLRFPLSSQDSALLSLEQIVEIIKIDSTEILPVPEMPSCVLGLCNWRGEILWLLDFNDFTGYPSPFQQEQGQGQRSLVVMVLQVENQSVGIGVSQVNDVELHDLQSLQTATPGLFPPGLLPLIAGVLPGCLDAVLDMKAIAWCPLWKNQPREVL